jgi:hypothetical protein
MGDFVVDGWGTVLWGEEGLMVEGGLMTVGDFGEVGFDLRELLVVR